MNSKLATFALVAVLPLAVGAQSSSKPQTREGFTIAFGFGTGSVGLSCDGCGSVDRQSDPTGFLRIGGTVRPNLTVAGETRGWTHEVDANTTATVGFLLANVHYYPRPANGWYLEGGLGIGEYRNTDAPTGNEFTATGGALSLGTGYDIRVGRNFSLTPFLSWAGTGNAKVKQNGVAATGSFDVNLLQIGLGFTWH